MSDEPAVEPQAERVPAGPSGPRPARLVRWAAAGLLLAGLIAAALGSAAWWALRSEPGSAWLVSRLPSVEVTNPRGVLLGDFEADRVQVSWGEPANRVVMQGFGWRGLTLRRGTVPGSWARIAAKELRAARIDLVMAPSQASKTPTAAPTRLDLPVQVDIAALRVDAFHTAALGDAPVRDLRAHVQLGAAGGSEHRIDELSVAWDRLQATGSARIATQAPLPMALQIELTQAGGPSTTPASTPPSSRPVTAPAAPGAPAADLSAWRASVALNGALASPTLQASLRSPASATQAAQALDVRAGLKPFEAWPLADLQASTRAFDLSALSRAAPVTALTGRATIQTEALDRPIAAHIELANEAAGRWNEGRLPVRRLVAELSGRATDRDQLDLTTLEAELGTATEPAGRLNGRGQWTPARSTLDATLRALQPSRLDTRAPEMQLDGPVALVLTTPPAPAASSASSATPATPAPVASAASAAGAVSTTGALRPTLAVRLDLAGVLSSSLGQGRVQTAGKTVKLQLEAQLDADHVELRRLQASEGGASASLSGDARRTAAEAPWQLRGRAALVDFDPLTWWPGRADSPWRRGPNRLNASGDFDVRLAAASAPWTALKGDVRVELARSTVSGRAVEGSVQLRSADAGAADATLALQVAGNRLQAKGRFDPTTGPAAGRADRWELTLDAPELAAFEPLWRVLQPDGAGALAGALQASGTVNGRWPELSAAGELTGSSLRVAATTVQRAEARWSLGTTAGAPLNIEANLTQLRVAPAASAPAADGTAAVPGLESARLSLKGTAAKHTLDVDASSNVRPPAWTEALQPTAAARAAAATGPRSVLRLRASGSAYGPPGQPLAGWRGRIGEISWRANQAEQPAWMASRDIDVEFAWGDGPMRLAVQPGSADVLGAALRWSRLSWQAAMSANPTAGVAGSPAEIQAQLAFEPIPVAPLLVRLQPSFGWGGDLRVGGRVDLHNAGGFVADIVVERSSGDLTVTDEASTQSLGLSDLRMALNAQGGVWTFSQYLNGRTLGIVAGAVVARTTPDELWPPADTPIQGAIELGVANLGTWGTWVPAGWRLGGQLKVSALFSGRFGAPQVDGDIEGHALSVRNFLEGVNVSGGEVAIALRGETARIERLSARGGEGRLDIEGSASLGKSPSATLQLKADKFVLLGRVDRRIVTSGQSRLAFAGNDLSIDGNFTVDEGLIDFTRSDAPALSSDVQVVRPAASGAHNGAPSEPAAAPAAAPTSTRQLALNLKIGLGNQLRLRGRGIETGLRGDLTLTSPGGRLAVNGSVRTVDGTYAAYGQKLSIDRGFIRFNGPMDNPTLNIEATRPNTDLRVGVQVTGTAQNPRIRLFSEPEVSDIDKLSWLALGRASDGLGTADTALLQTAALALLAGEGDGITEQFTRAIGLDELTLKQNDGEVRETVISLGKQLSRRWYVGYERGLNATEGSWQLIYRVARQFTLRAQSGLDNSLDLIWTWRWG